jgi:hypothetical protein
MVGSAIKVTDWRLRVNELYVTLNSALITISAYLLAADGNMAIPIVAIFGILLSLIWRNNIIDYRILSGAKWKVVGEIEEKEFKYEVFSRERKFYKEKGRLGSTLVEKYIPYWFISIYVVVIIISIIKVL